MIATSLAALLVPTQSFAHGGGPLDGSGCHPDRRVHDYHCHSGKLRGKHFKSRADMLRMLKTGDDTSTSARHPGHFQDLTKSVDRKDADNDPAQPAPANVSGGQPSAEATVPATTAAAGPAISAPVSLEERLSVLKRLYDKDLITKREYDEKRQQLLDSL